MRRRRWYFGNFSVLAENKDQALAYALALDPFFIYERWRTWG